MSFFSIFIPVFSFCLNILSQILFYRIKKTLLKSEYTGFIIGFVFLLICELSVYQNQSKEWPFLFCVNLIIYLSFSYCYFQFINMGETARRIRLLRELYEQPKGQTKEQILAKYNARDIIDIRIKRLLNNKQVIPRGTKYYLRGTSVLFISKLILIMKWIILGAGSEFKQGKNTK